MIVVWGLLEDPPTRAVYRALLERDVTPLFVDQAQIDAFEIIESPGGDELSWPGSLVPVAEMSALYLRPYDVRQIPDLDLEGEAGSRVDVVQGALMCRANDVSVVAVNRPESYDLNGSKPAQLQLIQRFAPELSIPRTIVTTSPAEVSRFVSNFGRSIVKSVSGHRSRVREISPEDLKPERLDSVRTCPVQVQQWVSGIDVRVHVVGNKLFATQINSDAMDYRYEQASLSAVDVPEWVGRACVTLAERMGLRVAGVDVRRTADGQWFCFEVNPSPAFTYYEGRTGQPIAAAIADLLTTSASCQNLVSAKSLA